MWSLFLRRLLRWMPGLQSLSPNALSLLGFVPGLGAAYCLGRGWWIGALLCILGRMVINTLDGLVAEEFGKTSKLGAYLNRLPGEFTDLLIILGLWPHGDSTWMVALLLLTGWVQLFGLLGLVAGGTVQPVGPCGQTDRLAWLGLGCLLAQFGLAVWGWGIPFLVVGCGLTLVLRIGRSIKQIRALDRDRDPASAASETL